MIPAHQMFPAGDGSEHGLKTTRLIGRRKSEVTDDPQIIIRPHGLLHRVQHAAVHLADGGEGPFAEIHDARVAEMRVGGVEVRHGSVPLLQACERQRSRVGLASVTHAV